MNDPIPADILLDAWEYSTEDQMIMPACWLDNGLDDSWQGGQYDTGWYHDAR